MERNTSSNLKQRTLLDPRFDHDSCGVGFVATLRGNSTHEILQLALTALGRLAHRGAIAADGKSSDGVGVMTGVPRSLLLGQAAIQLRAEQPLAVGMLFLPRDAAQATRDMSCFMECVCEQGLDGLGWRDVPISPEVL